MLLAAIVLLAPLLAAPATAQDADLERARLALLERAFPDPAAAPVDFMGPGSRGAFLAVLDSDLFRHRAVGPFDVYVMLADGLASSREAEIVLRDASEGLAPVVPVMERFFGGEDGLIAGRRMPIVITHEARHSAYRDDPAYLIDRLAGQRCPITAYPWPDDCTTPEHYRALAADLNATGAALKEVGLTLAYHNHALEFQRLDGEWIEGVPEFAVGRSQAVVGQVDPAQLEVHEGPGGGVIPTAGLVHGDGGLRGGPLFGGGIALDDLPRVLAGGFIGIEARQLAKQVQRGGVVGVERHGRLIVQRLGRVGERPLAKLHEAARQCKQQLTVRMVGR